MPLITGRWAPSSGRLRSARQFEVASHHWIDLTDKSGAYGATILTDVKNGIRQARRSTIRLTLLRTPGVPSRGPSQDRFTAPTPINSTRTGDIMRFSTGLPGTLGDWRRGQTDWQAYRLSTPLVAFTTGSTRARLGRTSR